MVCGRAGHRRVIVLRRALADPLHIGTCRVLLLIWLLVRWILVRPDGYIGVITPSAAVIRDWLARWTHPGH
jgi:hypothetical protein